MSLQTNLQTNQWNPFRELERTFDYSEWFPTMDISEDDKEYTHLE